MTLEKLETKWLITTPLLETRKNIITLNGLCPYGKSEWDFRITSENAKKTASTSMGASKELAYNVPFVLKEKNALVFQGLRTEGHVEGLCYVGRPHRRFRADGTEFQVKDDEYFLVYITQDRIIYHSRWEPLSAKVLEKDFVERFHRRIR